VGKTLKEAAESCAQVLTVEYEDGSEKVLVRTRTDPEIRASEEAVLEYRKSLRERYKPGSDFYQDIIEDLRLESQQRLIEIILDAEARDLVAKARRHVPTPIPPDMSRDLGPNEREKLDAEYEVRKAEYVRLLEEKARAFSVDREEKLSGLSDETLVEEATKITIRAAVEMETGAIRQFHMIKDSVRQADDPSKPYFANIEELQALPAQALGMLAIAVSSVDSVTGFDIKNSLGRSVLQIGPAESTPEATKDHSTRPSQGSSSRKKTSCGGAKRS